MPQRVSRRRVVKTGLVGLGSVPLGGAAVTGARGSAQPANTFTIETFSGDPELHYEFTVDGAVAKGPAADDNDSITDDNGESWVRGEVGNGYADEFRVAAEPSGWSANLASDSYRLLYNGAEIPPPTGGAEPPNTFTIETFADEPELTYEFVVDGEIRPGPAADHNDSITDDDGDSRVRGEVGNGYADDYRLEGEPTDWSANLDADQFRLLYNGTEYSIDEEDPEPPSDTLEFDVAQIDAGEFPEIDTFVSVRADEEPLAGLEAEDFSLTEDGTAQTITDVTQVGGSSSELSVVLLLDTSPSMDPRLADAKRGARAFVDTLGSDDRAAVVQYNATVTVAQEFTSDEDRLHSTIDSLSTSSWTSLFDGVEESIDLAAGATGRTAIIVLADGQNNHDPDGDGLTIDGVIDQASTANVPVYTIGLDTDYYNPTNLQRLAEETGGLFFEAADADDLERIYDDIGETISSEYRLRYTTTNDSRDDTERTVEASVRTDDASGSDTGSYVAPGESAARICPNGVEIGREQTGEMAIWLRDVDGGFAGGEFRFRFPEIARPVSVRANRRFGQRDTSVNGQEVLITVSDTADAFQGQRSEFRLGWVRVRGVDEGTDTVSVDPIQADDDSGRPIDLRLGSDCGRLTVSEAACPTVDGTETTDPDDDGRCEDLNGNGRRDFDDVNTFFDEVFANDEVTENVGAFDFNDDGAVDVVDVQALFHEQQEVR